MSGLHLPIWRKLVLLADYFWCLKQIISWEEYHLNLPIDVLQKRSHTDGTPVSDVILVCSNFLLTVNVRFSLVISDMAFRAMVDQYGTGEGKVESNVFVPVCYPRY